MADTTIHNTLNDIQREYQDFLDDDNDDGSYRVSANSNSTYRVI